MDRLADYVNKVVVLDAITGEVVPPPAKAVGDKRVADALARYYAAHRGEE